MNLQRVAVVVLLLFASTGCFGPSVPTPRAKPLLLTTATETGEWLIRFYPSGDIQLAQHLVNGQFEGYGFRWEQDTQILLAAGKWSKGQPLEGYHLINYEGEPDVSRFVIVRDLAYDVQYFEEGRAKGRVLQPTPQTLEAFIRRNDEATSALEEVMTLVEQ